MWTLMTDREYSHCKGRYRLIQYYAALFLTPTQELLSNESRPDQKRRTGKAKSTTHEGSNFLSRSSARRLFLMEHTMMRAFARPRTASWAPVFTYSIAHPAIDKRSAASWLEGLFDFGHPGGTPDADSSLAPQFPRGKDGLGGVWAWRNPRQKWGKLQHCLQSVKASLRPRLHKDYINWVVWCMTTICRAHSEFSTDLDPTIDKTELANHDARISRSEDEHARVSGAVLFLHHLWILNTSPRNDHCMNTVVCKTSLPTTDCRALFSRHKPRKA